MPEFIAYDVIFRFDDGELSADDALSRIKSLADDTAAGKEVGDLDQQIMTLREESRQYRGVSLEEDFRQRNSAEYDLVPESFREEVLRRVLDDEISEIDADMLIYRRQIDLQG